MLYKYKSVRKFEFLVDIIQNNRLYFPKVSELNDPMEGINDLSFSSCGNSYWKEEGKFDILWTPYKETLDKYRVLSLSKDCENILMWSHYAGNFSGVCMGFDETKTFREAKDVVYSEKIFPVNQNDTLEKVAYDTLQYKNKDWVYEKEKRIVKICSEKYFYFNKMEIRELIFGPKMDDIYREKIFEIISKYNPNVEIKQAYVNLYQYKIDVH